MTGTRATVVDLWTLTPVITGGWRERHDIPNMGMAAPGRRSTVNAVSARGRGQGSMLFLLTSSHRSTRRAVQGGVSGGCAVTQAHRGGSGTGVSRQ